MAKTQQKHVEKAWMIKGVPKQGKTQFISGACVNRQSARWLLGQFRTETRAQGTMSVVRVEIREL